VVPAREELRNSLRHVPTGRRFRAEGSVEWPMDSFTVRRLRDGDIKIVTAEEEEKKEPAPAHHARRGQSSEA
jgi:hypothetical protein